MESETVGRKRKKEKKWLLIKVELVSSKKKKKFLMPKIQKPIGYDHLVNRMCTKSRT